MRVIIQDAKTKRYYSASGKWVVAKKSARDFSSLIQAYHFAKRHTSRRFAVVLFSPDDNYHASIIEGEGRGEDVLCEAMAVVAKKHAVKHPVEHNESSLARAWSKFHICMSEGGNLWN